MVQALRALSLGDGSDQKAQPEDGSSGQNKIDGCPTRRPSAWHIAWAALANLWMTISVFIDLFRPKLPLFVTHLCSLRSQFCTGWLSKAFSEELVAQTLNTGLRSDVLHPLQSIRIGRMAQIHLFAICPYSSQLLASLRVKIPPIKVSDLLAFRLIT